MNNNLDASIPILTEVITAPATVAPAAAPEHAANSGDMLANGSTVTVIGGKAEATPSPEATAAQQWSEKDWEQLEHRLSERVLRQLQGRVDLVLEQRVRDSLADVLQLALVGLTNELKRGLQQTMEEVIARAVKQEISRLQSQKK